MVGFICKYPDYIDEHASLGMGLVASAHAAAIRDAEDRCNYDGLPVSDTLKLVVATWTKRIQTIVHDRERFSQGVPAVLTRYVDVTMAKRIADLSKKNKGGLLDVVEEVELAALIEEYKLERRVAIQDQIDLFRIVKPERDLSPTELSQLRILQKKSALLQKFNDPLLLV